MDSFVKSTVRPVFIKVTLIFSALNEKVHVKSYQLLDVLYRNISPSFTSKAFLQEVLRFELISESNQ